MKPFIPVLFDKLSKTYSPKSNYSFWQMSLTRDIENLLNEASHNALLDLKAYPYAANSVLNLGFSAFSESISLTTDSVTLAQKISRILAAYEPRLDPNSIKVTPVIHQADYSVLSILFDIYAISYFNNEKLALNLRIELDSSCGAIKAL